MDKKKKNILIGGLLAVVLLLAVGYAAFATTLTINGTSSIDSRWDVHIKDNGVSVKSSIMATSTRAQKDSQLTASFQCELTDPGVSTISYDIVVENSGTFGAKLSSINLTGTTAYIDATTEGIEVGDVIDPNGGTDTLTVTVSYKNVTEVPTGEDATANIIVTLNYIQDGGSAVATTNNGVASNYTGTIYAWNTNELTLGESTIDEIVSPTAQNYYTSLNDMKSALNAKGHSRYIQYTVNSGTLTDAYVCEWFGLNITPVCVQGGADTNGITYYHYYTGTPVEGNYKKMVELNQNPDFLREDEDIEGNCDWLDDGASLCSYDTRDLIVNSDGDVYAIDNYTDARCDIWLRETTTTQCENWEPEN